MRRFNKHSIRSDEALIRTLKESDPHRQPGITIPVSELSEAEKQRYLDMLTNAPKRPRAELQRRPVEPRDTTETPPSGWER